MSKIGIVVNHLVAPVLNVYRDDTTQFLVHQLIVCLADILRNLAEGAHAETHYVFKSYMLIV